MNLLDELVRQLKIDEGYTFKAFWDNKQYTNGYGTKALSETEFITVEEAEERLRVQAQKSLDDVVRNFDFILDLKIILALANMRFNLGLKGLLSFQKMIIALKNYDYPRAGFEAFNSKWYKQVGGRDSISFKEFLYKDLRRSERIALTIGKII